MRKKRFIDQLIKIIFKTRTLHIVKLFLYFYKNPLHDEYDLRRN
jgi:hypothetical protein